MSRTSTLPNSSIISLYTLGPLLCLATLLPPSVCSSYFCTSAFITSVVYCPFTECVSFILSASERHDYHYCLLELNEINVISPVRWGEADEYLTFHGEYVKYYLSPRKWVFILTSCMKMKSIHKRGSRPHWILHVFSPLNRNSNARSSINENLFIQRSILVGQFRYILLIDH